MKDNGESILKIIDDFIEECADKGHYWAKVNSPLSLYEYCQACGEVRKVHLNEKH